MRELTEQSQFIRDTVAILGGIGIGLVWGFVAGSFYEFCYQRKVHGGK